MRYRLINKSTNEETICEKVIVDGFDYYVSDEETKWAIDEPNKLVNVWFYPEKLKGFVLATNNANIDIPKVVNEVENLAFLECFNKWDSKDVFDSNDLFATDCFKKGYKKSQETYSFADYDMIEFAEWRDEYLEGLNKWVVSNVKCGDMFTTKELLDIWKEQRIKTLYYE